MPKERLSMRKIKEVLRLFYDKRISQRAIAGACGIARSTVQDYIKRFEATGLMWPLPEEVDDSQLNQLLFSRPTSNKTDRPHADWPYIHQELARKGVTLKLLWQEYRQLHPDGYGYTRFCQLYRSWARKLKVSMRQVHKAGEKTFVDYAGLSMELIDPLTGEVKSAQVFVAVLGASHYIYAEASASQSLTCWLSSHVRAFRYFGGVTEIIVPDNLKSGVAKPCRYEPELNPSYQDLAQHYAVAIIPARVAKPKDKAKVEVAIQLVERWVLAPLRNRTFFSMEELNKAIFEKLEQLNNRPMKALGKSRKELFELLDKPALNPLPKTDYQIALWKKARVNLDYHVELDKHYYSVPFTLVHKPVEMRYTEKIVEVFYQATRVASHLRSYLPHRHTTQTEHMPEAHQKMLEWTPSRFLRWAEKIGPNTKTMIDTILNGRQHPEQGYRSCLGLLRLEKTYGRKRLERACQRALHFGLCSRKHVLSILKNKQDLLDLPQQEQLISAPHANIRGAHFYK